jgi:DNA-binding response OmpR family regulator/methylmalonyl-CoA mutase cobalamin-binding subunit
MTTKQRVLVIDDDKDALRLTGYIFHKAGYEVHVAKDGHEGLEKVNQVKPHLIILDVMMPDMSGLEVCQRLRSQPATATLPIIMLSAKGQVDDKVSGLQAGADDYLQKPVDAKELLARASALLTRASYTIPTSKRRARIITVVGVKGGVGATTVAVNVAASLITKKKAVTLAELCSYRGTAAHNLKLNPVYDLGNLLAMDPGQITHEEVTKHVARHASGLRVLIAPRSIAGHEVTTAHAETILDSLSLEADYLILDLPSIAGEAMRLALGRSSQILLVTEPEEISIACASADLEALNELGFLDRVDVVVISRTASSLQMRGTEVGNRLNVNTMGIIPPAPEAFFDAGRVGAPIVVVKPDHLAAKALVELAEKLAKKLPVTSE